MMDMSFAFFLASVLGSWCSVAYLEFSEIVSGSELLQFITRIAGSKGFIYTSNSNTAGVYCTAS